MNLIKVLHETAMEYVDFADRAKKTGDVSTYSSLIKKAYLLEKEAAIKMFYQSDTKQNLWRFLLLKSAGWLALQAGNQEEAAYFVELGLNNQPPDEVKQQFLELLTEVTTTQSNTKDSFDGDNKPKTELPIQIKGILIQASADQKAIYLQDPHNQNTYIIHVPDHLINEIVKSYWSALVTIDGKTNPLGIITLEKIQLAA